MWNESVERSEVSLGVRSVGADVSSSIPRVSPPTFAIYVVLGPHHAVDRERVLLRPVVAANDMDRAGGTAVKTGYSR